MNRLKGKAAIIAGAGPGFGTAIAELFGQEGASVVAADIRMENAQKTAERVEKTGSRAIAVKTDICSEDEVDAMVKAAVDAFGKVDILVNNAGLQGPQYWADFLQIERNAAYKSIAVNFTGAWLCINAVAPYMVKNNGGSVISIASAAGVKGGGAIYGPTKGGVIAMARGIGQDLGKVNIRVNTISPYTAITPTLAGFFGEDSSRMDDYFANDALLKHTVRMEDIANAALFLASDESRAITGFDIRVDCGATQKAQSLFNTLISCGLSHIEKKNV